MGPIKETDETDEVEHGDGKITRCKSWIAFTEIVLAYAAFIVAIHLIHAKYYLIGVALLYFMIIYAPFSIAWSLCCCPEKEKKAISIPIINEAELLLNGYVRNQELKTRFPRELMQLLLVFYYEKPEIYIKKYEFDEIDCEKIMRELNRNGLL